MSKSKNVTFELGADVGGTHLQSYLDVSYADLVATFGKPNSDGDGYKVDAEWEITLIFPNGDKLPATIYNYKTGKNYDEEDGLDVEDIRDWHIGGKSDRVVEPIKRLIAEATPKADTIATGPNGGIVIKSENTGKYSVEICKDRFFINGPQGIFEIPYTDFRAIRSCLGLTEPLAALTKLRNMHNGVTS